MKEQYRKGLSRKSSIERAILRNAILNNSVLRVTKPIFFWRQGLFSVWCVFKHIMNPFSGSWNWKFINVRILVSKFVRNRHECHHTAGRVVYEMIALYNVYSICKDFSVVCLSKVSFETEVSQQWLGQSIPLRNVCSEHVWCHGTILRTFE